MDEQRKDCKVCTRRCKKQISTWLRSRNPLLQQPDTGLTVALYANTEQIWTQSCTLAISMVNCNSGIHESPNIIRANTCSFSTHLDLCLGPLYFTTWVTCASWEYTHVAQWGPPGLHKKNTPQWPLLTISKYTLIPMIVIYVSGCWYTNNTLHGWLQERRIHRSSQAASWEHSWAKH